jgi:hypothetical protein
MPAIIMTAFQGEQPRIVPRLLPPSGAQDAVNVRLDDGGLTPVRAPKATGQNAVAGARTIARHGNTWLSWAANVNAVPGPVASDRLYITGDGVPKMRTLAGTVYSLAVPRPTAAPGAAVSGTGSGDIVTRTYVYTFVTSFGEESEPSPPSAAVDWRPGQSVLLSGIQAAPAGRDITLQRVYRTQTGTQGTYLYLIAERAASNANYSDVIAPNAFQEPLPSVDWTPPPNGLLGLTALPNGMMAGFVGKDLYFCEPYRPHAWPEKYVLTTDAEIVGLAAIGAVLIIMTKANPFVAAGAEPGAMQMQRIEQNLPCINARSIVDLGFAVAYASHEGLVAVRSDGSAQIVTYNLFSRDDWLHLSPDTMAAAHIAGRYAAFYDDSNPNQMRAGCVIIDIAGQQPFLSRFDVMATAAAHDVPSGGLFYVPKDSLSIFRLDSPEAAPGRFVWKSKPFYFPAPENFGVLLIDADPALNADDIELTQIEIDAVMARNAAKIAARSAFGTVNGRAINVIAAAGDVLERVPGTSTNVEVTVSADADIVASVNRINQPVRLPSGFKSRSWDVTVTGNIRVERVTLASTMADLTQSPAG